MTTETANDIGCTCRFQTLASPLEMYGMRFGAHEESCAIYRVSGDPVDDKKDIAHREAIMARQTTETTARHAPRPWRSIRVADCDLTKISRRIYDANGQFITEFSINPDANAHHIVACVNSQAALLAACEAFLRAPSIGSSGPGSVTIEVQTFNLDAARAAIAQATGQAVQVDDNLELHGNLWEEGRA